MSPYSAKPHDSESASGTFAGSLGKALLCCLLSIVLTTGLLPVVPNTAYAEPAAEEAATPEYAEAAPVGAEPAAEEADRADASDGATPSRFEGIDEEGLDLADEELLVVYKDEQPEVDEQLAVDEDKLPSEAVATLAASPAADTITLEDAGVTKQETVVEANSERGAIAAVDIADDVPLAEAAQAIEAMDAVDYVDFNYRVYPMATSVNDPYAVASASSALKQPWLYNIGAPEAWDYAKTDHAVSVAVIDTGCRGTHADLEDNIDAENAYDITANKTLDITSDTAGGGHGTGVAGVVAATANNSIGMAGVSYNALVVPIRVYDANGACDSGDITSAITWLDDHYDDYTNLKVVNMSLGFYPGSSTVASVSSGQNPLYNAIKSLRENHDVLVVCAAGNGDQTTGNAKTDINYPSDMDVCMAVAAVDDNNVEARFSDYNKYKDISAPGISILHPSASSNSSYATGNGTSYASPIVAGAAALLWAYRPNLTSEEVEEALLSTTDPIVNKHSTNASAGVLNVARAIALFGEYSIKLSNRNFTYTGSQICPTVEVCKGAAKVPSSAYSVSYSREDLTSVGCVSVVASGGSGESAWSVSDSYTINPRPVSDSAVKVSSIPSHVYTGNAIRPVPTVTYNGTTLRQGTDYTLSYSDNINAGTGRITIKGKGNYSGTRTVSFKIEGTEIASASITGVKASYAYTGSSISPAFTVTLDGKTLRSGVDYKATYSNNVNAGTAYLTVTGTGSYMGTVRKAFTIAEAPISNAQVSLSASSFAYDGNAKRPGVTVKANGRTLKSGTDYTVAYRNNVKAGYATATVTARGNYSGAVSRQFRINRASIAGASVALSASTLPYSGSALRPGVTVKLGGKVLKNGTDYTVSYKSSAGSSTGGSNVRATAIVTGRGNYLGSVSKAFTVKTPSVQYYVHRQTYGWEGAYSKRDGASSGTTGQKKRLEGIRIKLANKPVSGSIQYQTHVQKIGWQGWRNETAMSGTTGKKYRLEAIKIKLTGNMAQKYDVYYRVHAQKFGWMGWAKNGASAGTAGYAYRLESIQIKLVPKGAKAPTSAGGVGSTAGKAAFAQKR